MKDWKLVPAELTAENGMKAALIGEFHIPFPELDEAGNEYIRKVNVPWTVIKKIHRAIVAAAPTPPEQDDDNGGEDLTKFYIVREPGLVPRVCRPMGDDLAANLRDWFKHHPWATIDIARVRLIDGRVSDLWVDDGIEYLQILDDGGWIPERPDTSTPPAQEAETVYQVSVSGHVWMDTTQEKFDAWGTHTDSKKRILYTRPDRSELVLVAGQVLSYFRHADLIDCDEVEYLMALLRAAVESAKKSGQSGAE